jgi:DNA repair exonuclease SbcCD nuclease subunit
VLHTAFRHLLGFEGAWQLEYTDIPEYVDNVLVGDIHIHDVSKFENTTIYSPGAIYACNAAELKQDHGFYCIEEDGITYQHLDTRTFVNINMETPESVAEADKELKALDKEPSKTGLKHVAFVKTGKDIEYAFDKFENVVIVKIDAALKLVDVSDLNIDAVKGLDMKASLSAVIDRKKYPALYEFNEGLLDSENPKEYIADWLKARSVAMLDS